MEDIEELRRKLQSLEKELTGVKQRNAELERAKGVSGAGEETVIPVSEFEETLRRLVQRTAMIVQAEKCVIMVRDRETDDLVARSPAFGMTDAEVLSYRVPIEGTLDGQVFTEGAPTIFQATDEASEATRAMLGELRIRNGVTVPLIVDRRDDQNHIVDRLNIGVLHCFNKRYGGEFIQEDVSLLERLSRNAAAVIANAQIFQDLVEEKQKLVHTLESLTAGLLLVNQRGRIGQINAAARAIFGIKESDNPVGKAFEDYIKHEPCVAIIKRCMAEGVRPANDEEEGAKKPDEITVTDSDEEEFIYQVHAANVHDDANAPVGTVFIFNDITDLRNVERMKTEFVSIVSHELRTPLTPMKGFVRTLLDDENEEWYDLATRREFYTIIDENVDRLSRLINDLLNVSRIERMGVAGVEMNWEDKVGLRKATEEVLATQRGRTDKHTFVIDFEPEDIELESDPDKIQNILQNFVSNAIKYSPDGGEVRIIARLKPADDEFPFDSVVIGVKDQGMGIPESALKKLGEKFYRVNNTGTRKAGGTGIGLFLVRALIAAHKGTMHVESEMDKGSTFWIRLPLRQPVEGTTEEEKAQE
ncbi:MAG: sensor signal transduction histidine kinase [Chthonomonadaceae bacterium]|nr:sensor signal transduction histidine kinase [Chthonomonadaceae bacterium]